MLLDRYPMLTKAAATDLLLEHGRDYVSVVRALDARGAAATQLATGSHASAQEMDVGPAGLAARKARSAQAERDAVQGGRARMQGSSYIDVLAHETQQDEDRKEGEIDREIAADAGGGLSSMFGR
jgi:hypothetical protein